MNDYNINFLLVPFEQRDIKKSNKEMNRSKTFCTSIKNEHFETNYHFRLITMMVMVNENSRLKIIETDMFDV